MARHKIVHSDDACCVLIEGDKRRPEPSTAVIKFPGGHIEVSRCSDGSYWVHLAVVDHKNIVDSRVDYAHGGQRSVRDLPEADLVNKVALRVSNAVAHPDLGE